MRTWREQPRVVAAKLAVALVVVVAAGFAGSLLASNDGQQAELRLQLQRSEQRRSQRDEVLARLRSNTDRLRARLVADARSRRAHQGVVRALRRDLRVARRKLARARAE